MPALWQCEFCARYFEPGGALLEPQPRLGDGIGVPEIFGCGREDCDVVVAEQQAAERARAHERRRVRGAKCEVRNERRKPSRRTKAVRSAPPPAGAPSRSLPYPDRELMEPVTGPDVSEVQSPKSEVQREDSVSARELGQSGFLARGAADAANSRLIAFFERPEHFGRWYAARFLLETVCGWASTHMNNRAVDIRPHFVAQGLFIDNSMRLLPGVATVQSCYRVCRLQDAESLSETAKAEWLQQSQL